MQSRPFPPQDDRFARAAQRDSGDAAGGRAVDLRRRCRFSRRRTAGRTAAVTRLVQPQQNVWVVEDLDEYRLPAVTTLDLRLEKAVRLWRSEALIDPDFFNLANVWTPLRSNTTSASPIPGPSTTTFSRSSAVESSALALKF